MNKKHKNIANIQENKQGCGN